jgi:hypothetical protein
MVLKSLYVFLHEKQSCDLLLYQDLIPGPDNFLLKFAASVANESEKCVVVCTQVTAHLSEGTFQMVVYKRLNYFNCAGLSWQLHQYLPTSEH